MKKESYLSNVSVTSQTHQEATGVRASWCRPYLISGISARETLHSRNKRRFRSLVALTGIEPVF
jgi:hypothetical protein